MGFKARGSDRRQLVIQFPDTFFTTFDEMIDFEDRLIGWMSKNTEVDGHDFGSGTINFFLYTVFPEAAFRIVRSKIATRKMEAKMRVAHRSIDNLIWTELWPKRPRRGQKPFDYLYRP